MYKNPVINIVRDHQSKTCATCRHAALVSYAPYDPLIAECRQQHATAYAANIHSCKQYDRRHKPAVISYRTKYTSIQKNTNV